MGKFIYILIKSLSYLPFWFWHGFADILYILNFYLIGYRKKVVLENLKIAFPDKTESERKKIAKKFFRNFSDFIIESIKVFSMSEKQFKKRYVLENVEEVKAVMQRTQKGAIATAAHVFNWEWMISIGTYLGEGFLGRVAYTPLSNKTLDYLIRNNRERFGLKLTRSSAFKNELEGELKDHLTFTGLIADQSPQKQYKFRTDFFGVNVPVFTGPETMAKRLDHSFWFLWTKKYQGVSILYHLN